MWIGAVRTVILGIGEGVGEVTPGTFAGGPMMISSIYGGLHFSAHLLGELGMVEQETTIPHQTEICCCPPSRCPRQANKVIKIISALVFKSTHCSRDATTMGASSFRLDMRL